MVLVWLLHGTEALVYSDHPIEAAPCLGDCRWITSGIPSFLRSTVVLMQLQQLLTINCLTLGLSCGMNEGTLNYCSSGHYRTRRWQSFPRRHSVSALNCLTRVKSPTAWACLGVNPLDITRTIYTASEGNSFKFSRSNDKVD